jgi:hypothetical protein
MISKRMAYFKLLGIVYDDLPEDAVSKTILAGSTAQAVTLQSVRRGATARLDLLVEMVRICLPEQVIPDEILNSLS